MKPPKRKTNKYQPLGDYLRKCANEKVCLSLLQIEKILGFSLPKSSAINSWWSNNPEDGHYQAQAWTDAGYRVMLEGDTRIFMKREPQK